MKSEPVPGRFVLNDVVETGGKLHFKTSINRLKFFSSVQHVKGAGFSSLIRGFSCITTQGGMHVFHNTERAQSHLMMKTTKHTDYREIKRNKTPVWKPFSPLKRKKEPGFWMLLINVTATLSYSATARQHAWLPTTTPFVWSPPRAADSIRVWLRAFLVFHVHLIADSHKTLKTLRRYAQTVYSF